VKGNYFVYFWERALKQTRYLRVQLVNRGLNGTTW